MIGTSSWVSYLTCPWSAGANSSIVKGFFAKVDITITGDKYPLFISRNSPHMKSAVRGPSGCKEVRKMILISNA